LDAFSPHFDPRITVMFTASAEQLTVGDRYERIALPVHLVRGATSDILPAEMAERMIATEPRSEITQFEDCGHAPTLSRPADIEAVRDTLVRLCP
jgi:pimeloyl-ACP methyl ester carboxylesterase